MKNKLISQKTRSRASKVVLALFFCTIMISSLCSFTVGDTFTFPETPPEYDYMTYDITEDNILTMIEQIMSNAWFGLTVDFGDGADSIRLSVPFYSSFFDSQYGLDGVLYFGFELGDDFTAVPYSSIVNDFVGASVIVTDYLDDSYTLGFLEAIGFDAPPNPTESLTNVWDGILNWITTSISSLQNVFWQEGTVVDFNSDVDTSDAITINDTVLYKTNIVFLETDNIYIDGDNVSEAISRYTHDVNGIPFVTYSYNGIPLFAGTDATPDETLLVYTNTDVDYYFVDSTGGSLTLLGTLCCIAVAISVVFLLIGTIVNFLKLRS